MSKKGRRIFTIILIIIMTLMIILPTLATIISIARAATSAEIQEKIDSLKGEAGDLTSQKAAIQKEINALTEQETTTGEKKRTQDDQIELTRREIENTVAQMQQYSLLIAAKQQELDDAIRQEQERREQLQSRIRAMEEYGDSSYIAILFEASSFADFLGRMEIVRDLMNYENSVLESLAEAQSRIDDARVALEENKVALNDSKALLEEQEGELQAQLAESDELLMQLHEEKRLFAEEYASVEQQENELWDNIDALVEEYERTKKAEEEEAARLAAIEAEKEKGNTYVTGGGLDSSLAWPVDCYTITDPFGNRLHPVLGVWKLHTGVDIAAWYGQTISAAKSGRVLVAESSYAYGNYVVIVHDDSTTTLYAHMSSMAVSKGDYVIQGATLGYVGSSGFSTGPHLHFEVRDANGYYTDPLQYYSYTFTFV